MLTRGNDSTRTDHSGTTTTDDRPDCTGVYAEQDEMRGHERRFVDVLSGHPHAVGIGCGFAPKIDNLFAQILDVHNIQTAD